MIPLVEKLVEPADHSFRSFDRRTNRLPSRLHCHPEFELTYVPTGSGDRLVGDHIGRFNNDDLVLLGKNLPHNWISDEYRDQKIDMHEAYVTQFKYDFLGPGFFQIPEASDLLRLLKNAKRGLWFPPHVAKPIGKRLQQLPSMKGIRQITVFLELLDDLSRSDEATPLASEGYLLETNNPQCTSKPKTENDNLSKIQLIIDHVAQNLADPELTVHQLAKLVGMNKSAFCRFFRNKTGRTPTGYINDLRLGYARQRLLEDNDAKIIDVCMDAGFLSASYFNKLFKQHYGMTPSRYRKTYGEMI